MMKITVRTFAMIREAIGHGKFQFEVQNGISIFDALSDISVGYPKTKNYLFYNEKISNSLVIAINGKEIHPGQYNSYILEEKDEIVIIPPAGGG
ncbi:MAG: MoaD/ThiS family protein [Candidatus Kariarchaeaceae archaeon]|jgi:MoaD family protein